MIFVTVFTSLYDMEYGIATHNTLAMPPLIFMPDLLVLSISI